MTSNFLIDVDGIEKGLGTNLYPENIRSSSAILALTSYVLI